MTRLDFGSLPMKAERDFVYAKPGIFSIWKLRAFFSLCSLFSAVTVKSSPMECYIGLSTPGSASVLAAMDCSEFYVSMASALLEGGDDLSGYCDAPFDHHAAAASAQCGVVRADVEVEVQRREGGDEFDLEQERGYLHLCSIPACIKAGSGSEGQDQWDYGTPRLFIPSDFSQYPSGIALTNDVRVPPFYLKGAISHCSTPRCNNFKFAHEHAAKYENATDGRGIGQEDGDAFVWPTTTSGLKKFLDTYGGTSATAIVAVGLAISFAVSGFNTAVGVAGSVGTVSGGAGGATGVSAGDGGSSVGKLETTQSAALCLAMLGHAQFLNMLGMMKLPQAPPFLFHFADSLSWTNFMLSFGSNAEDPAGQSDTNSTTNLSAADTSHRSLQAILPQEMLSQEGDSYSCTWAVCNYSQRLGFQPEYLLYYTVAAISLVLGTLVAIYASLILFSYLAKRDWKADERYLHRRVACSVNQLFLVSPYALSVIATFAIAYSFGFNFNAGSLFLAMLVLGVGVLGFLYYGIRVVRKYEADLVDVGTTEHKKKRVAQIYGPFYDTYNYSNRFFFVVVIVSSGLVGFIIGLSMLPSVVQLSLVTMVYAVKFFFLTWREPYLHVFQLNMIMLATAAKVLAVLLSFLLVVDGDLSLPSSARESVTYCIVAVNIFVLLALAIAQMYNVFNMWKANREVKKEHRHKAASDAKDRLLSTDKKQEVFVEACVKDGSISFAELATDSDRTSTMSSRDSRSRRGSASIIPLADVARLSVRSSHSGIVRDDYIPVCSPQQALPLCGSASRSEKCIRDSLASLDLELDPHRDSTVVNIDDIGVDNGMHFTEEEHHRLRTSQKYGYEEIMTPNTRTAEEPPGRSSRGYSAADLSSPF